MATELEQKIGFEFKNGDLLNEALTHRSYINENPEWRHPHNERLEFLGDAVLELAITEELFQNFPDFPEGQLTVLRASLVNYQYLSKIASVIDLDRFMYMSKGERGDTSKAREVILANAIEAVIGAMYLDQGFAPIKEFAKKYILVHLPEILETKSYKDAKSALQEMVQEKLRLTPTYKVIEESGPAHRRVFKIGVFFGEKLMAEGSGTSKQEGEIAAAKGALEKFDTE
jgi:ribonuclease-3